MQVYPLYLSTADDYTIGIFSSIPNAQAGLAKYLGAKDIDWQDKNYVRVDGQNYRIDVYTVDAVDDD